MGKVEGISRVVVGYRTEGYETVDMTSQGVDNLGEAAPYVVGAGTGTEVGVNAGYFLEVMVD